MLEPVRDLRLRHGAVSLRPVVAADLDTLAGLLPDDVGQDPARPHWPWQDERENRRRILVQAMHHAWAAWSPEAWELPLLASYDGAPVGVQTLEGTAFARDRTVDSASWLVPAARGRGLGVAMRTAVLGLAFDHLGAVAAVSSATLDNHASLGVSRHLGYRDDGLGEVQETHRVAVLQHLRLTRAEWRHAGEVEVDGVAACRQWFGAGSATPETSR